MDKAFVAGDTLTSLNNGDVIIVLHVTTAGTATLEGAAPAENIALTLPVGTTLLGPFDQAAYGMQVNVTVGTAAGSAILKFVTPRFPNGRRNPFQFSQYKPDSNFDL